MKRSRILQLAVFVALGSLPWLLAAAPQSADEPTTRPAAKERKKLQSRRKRANLMPQQGQGALDRGAGVAAATPSDTANRPAAVSRPPSDPRSYDPQAVAVRVDDMIAALQDKAGVTAAKIANDEDYLRRVSLDIAGVPPTSQEATLFALDPDPEKRRNAVERLLGSAEYGPNWARYWRDVIFYRATETRPQFLGRGRTTFESWMAGQLQANNGWHEIATAVLTATGETSTDGQTGLMLAQRAEPEEVAGEVSRIFLGIQIQCANCHDHPTDSWKREQFHGLAAFFPRMSLRPKREDEMPTLELASFDQGNDRPARFYANLREKPEGAMRRLDHDGDRALSKQEMTRPGKKNGQLDNLFALGDADKNGTLSIAELKKLPELQMAKAGRGELEYHMPDLNNPQAKGTKSDPVFFLGNMSAGEGLSDQERRAQLARYVTSPENPWFAKAFVNRIWAELVGEGFYMPIDDIGPERTATAPEALEVLSAGFVANGYDIKWLFRAITGTNTYQRAIRPRDLQQTAPTFAAAVPVRLRGDQLYDALTHALAVDELERQRFQKIKGLPRDPRSRFDLVFGFDPSTPPDENPGTLPQALFFMNERLIAGLIRGEGKTRLAQILEKHSDNDDATRELYLQVHAREPSARELQICRDYLKQVKDRREAYEDIYWSLLNSTEFQTKR